ncbi:MAG: hypothetical protein KKB21_01090 [Nanoarchaeota archaeon]|nr:hypothetical protein [Nanoarchaeota archaeon]
MNKRGISIWDVLAWIVLALILLWLILKTLGVINTSLLLEYAPIYGAVYLAGWQIHKLEIVASDVRELKRFKELTIKEINSIKVNCAKNHGK